MSSARKAVFLDRDGVINRRPPEGLYINSIEEFEILPGVIEAILQLNRGGFLVFVATNQRCIARGIVPAAVVEDIHRRFLAAVQAAGGDVTHIYVCPHDYAEACECRKPNPGMLSQAAKDYSLDLAKSWMVGDSASDIAAGRAACCRTLFIGGGDSHLADVAASDLAEAAERILAAS